jgi:hypothetical protein
VTDHVSHSPWTTEPTLAAHTNPDYARSRHAHGQRSKEHLDFPTAWPQPPCLSPCPHTAASLTTRILRTPVPNWLHGHLLLEFPCTLSIARHRSRSVLNDLVACSSKHWLRNVYTRGLPPMCPCHLDPDASASAAYCTKLSHVAVDVGWTAAIEFALCHIGSPHFFSSVRILSFPMGYLAHGIGTCSCAAHCVDVLPPQDSLDRFSSRSPCKVRIDAPVLGATMLSSSVPYFFGAPRCRTVPGTS